VELIIAIDDLHPEQGWGCEGDQSVEYLQELNNEFGCKFNLFIPSNYHDKYPLSQHKDWVEFWKKQSWVELSAHGHYHKCKRTDIGECEFFELDTEEKAKDRIEQCLSEWNTVDYRPKGWRNPGWLAHPEAIKVLGKYFDYTALHDEHNHNIKWDCKMFFGHDGIHESDSIQIYNNTFMFQSHIAGDWNDNIWNEANYEHFRTILKYLNEQYDIKYSTIGEL
jgi:predicted deacetylase